MAGTPSSGAGVVAAAATATAALALEEREVPERARLEALFKQLGLRKHCCDDGEEGNGMCICCIYALSIGWWWF